MNTSSPFFAVSETVEDLRKKGKERESLQGGAFLEEADGSRRITARNEIQCFSNKRPTWTSSWNSISSIFIFLVFSPQLIHQINWEQKQSTDQNWTSTNPCHFHNILPSPFFLFLEASGKSSFSKYRVCYPSGSSSEVKLGKKRKRKQRMGFFPLRTHSCSSIYLYK